MDERDFPTRIMGELDAVHAFAFHLRPDPGAAERLVEETYARALRASPAPIASGIDLRVWLLAAIYRAVAPHLSGAIERPTPVERMLGNGDSVPDVGGSTPACYDLSAVEWAHAHERLADAIALLPPAYRVIFFLWTISGCGYDQIARIIRLPPRTVRSRLYRARMIVSTQIGEVATEWGLGTSAYGAHP